MTSREFRARLTRRISQAGAPVPSPGSIERLEQYFSLLARWNARINLTSLPLEPPTDGTFDRLFIEPLLAARKLPDEPEIWLDLGSGGGSPAVPLKIVRPTLRLTMVEAKTRKAAFLREVARGLELPSVYVENARFEEVAGRSRGAARYVTVRAVRADARLVGAALALLEADGRLLLFRAGARPPTLPGFSLVDTAQLGSSGSCLTTYRRLFHVEQSG